MNLLCLAALTGCFAYGGIGGTTTDTLLQTQVATSTRAPTYETYSVTMTAYNAVPEQTDDSPEFTAIGAFTNPDIIAARSQDLADELPYGTVIAVVPATTTPNCGFKFVSEKIGLRVIGDSMHPRMHNKIDILMDVQPIRAQEGLLRNPAKAFGFCRSVQIQIVGKLDLVDDSGKIDWNAVKKIPKTQKALAAAVGLTELALK